MEPKYRIVTGFLMKNKLRLAVAESLTAGLLQSKMVALDGASEFFSGGVTAYVIDMKVNLLGVDRAEAEKTNAVAPQIAENMARGICELMQSQVGLATTGYAEPDANLHVETPYAYIGLFIRHGGAVISRSEKVTGEGLNRTEMLEYVAESAVKLLSDVIGKAFGEPV